MYNYIRYSQYGNNYTYVVTDKQLGVQGFKASFFLLIFFFFFKGFNKNVKTQTALPLHLFTFRWRSCTN